MRTLTGMVQPVRVGVAWFPADQFETALDRWPDLAAGLETRDYPTYCRMLEQTLTSMARQATPVLAPIDIADLETWATERGMDPGSREARSEYAADLARRPGPPGPAWPPAAEAVCWCGSGHAYRSCCRSGTAFHRPATR